MSGRPRVTASSIMERVTRLEGVLKSDDVNYIVARWLQGRALELPLAKVESLLLRPREVKATVEEAVKRILACLESPYGGVQIFSIESPRRLYGTGKTQIAYFVYKELESRGVPVEYLTASVGDVESGSFRARLWEAGKSKAEAAIFVDEVDVLVSPELGEERQAKVIEAFANAVIEYSEGLSQSKECNQALVLVLSFKAKEGIERVAQDRLGRRIMNALVEVDVSLTRDDVFGIFASASALATMYMSLRGETIWLLLTEFANDFGRCLWRDSDLASLSVGQAVASALNLTLRFSRGLRRSDPKKVLQGSLDSATLGTRVEKTVISTLSRVLPSYTFEVRDLQQTVECVISQTPIRVGNFRADMHYAIRLGRLEVGKCLVEVTAERELSSRKREQLRAFAVEYPTILVYAYEQPSQFEEIREFIEELPGHGVVPVDLPLPLFKYPAALEEYGEELAYRLAREIKLQASLEAALRKLAGAVVYTWFAVEKAREAHAKPEKEREKGLEEALRGSLKGALQHLFAASSKRAEKTITECFENALRKISPEIERSYVAVYTKDVVKEWADAGLGKLGEKFFIKSDSWDEEKAVEIAVSVFAPRLLKIRTPTGLENFLPEPS